MQDSPPISVPGLTVAICSYNRCESLEATLQSLTELRIPPGVGWELIVVNNGCTDATDEVIERFRERLPIQRTFAATPGLGAARNAALHVARGNVIAWTDDDCFVDAAWLERVWAEFEADPTLSGLGGRVELYDRRDAPITIRTSRKREEIGCGDPISHRALVLVPGCNMAFPRSIFTQLGEFDERLGAGTRSAAAEDTDLLYRILKSGGRIVYSPDAVVYHNHGRRTSAQMHSLRRGYATGRGAFYCKHIMAGDPDALRLALGEVLGPMADTARRIMAQARWIGNLTRGADSASWATERILLVLCLNEEPNHFAIRPL